MQEFSDPTGETPATLQDLEVIFGNVVGIILGLAGIIFFVILIIGGFKYITSGGDPQKVEGAKKTLTAGIGGLVLLVLAFLIILFIENFTGVEITTFKIFQEN